MCVIGSLICNQNDKLRRIDHPVLTVKRCTKDAVAAAADKIATMTDRIRTEIESDSEKTKVKKANSVGDEILEYTIFSMPKMAPTGYPLNLTVHHGYVTN